MKPTSLYIYASLLLFLCSCGKKDEQTKSKLDKVDARSSARMAVTNVNLNDIVDFYTFMETPTNGKFGIIHHSVKSATAQQNTVSDDSYTFNGAFYDANMNLVPGGKVTIAGVEFSPVNNFYSLNSYYIPGRPSKDPLKYGSLESQSIGFSIDPTPGGTTARPVPVPGPTTSTFYIPKKVSMATNGTKTQVGNNFFDVWTYQPLLNPKTLTITWNADPLNDKGVVIIFDYDNQISSMYYPGSPAYPVRHYKAFRVPDNGSYTLSATDLNEVFPDRDVYKQFNALISVTVGRANYSIISSGDNLKKYSIYAGSAQETPLVLNWLPQIRWEN
jgi:hypothetical protein